MAAIEITDGNFEELVLHADVPSLVEFGAKWCPPCKLIEPFLAEMHHEYAGKAVIGKLDVDDNPIVSTQFGVRNLPTLLYFKNGFVVDRQVGAVPKNVLTEKLVALFG